MKRVNGQQKNAEWKLHRITIPKIANDISMENKYKKIYDHVVHYIEMLHYLNLKNLKLISNTSQFSCK